MTAFRELVGKETGQYKKNHWAYFPYQVNTRRFPKETRIGGWKPILFSQFIIFIVKVKCSIELNRVWNSVALQRALSGPHATFR